MFLCNDRWIISIDHFEKGKTINSGYYEQLLDHLNVDIKTLAEKISFYIDNVSAHSSRVAAVKIED